MSYFTQRSITSTNDCPTYAGFHRNMGTRDSELFHGCWTLRFGDEKKRLQKLQKKRKEIYFKTKFLVQIMTPLPSHLIN